MTETGRKPARPAHRFRLFEVGFNALYLLLAAGIGMYIFRHRAGPAALLAGTMALVLAAGDAFHLVPRIMAALSDERERLRSALGYGKMVASITMTAFYVLLWHIGMLVFSPPLAAGWTVAVYALAALRILLCLPAQNGWTEARPPLRWAVLRNIPFLMLGIMTASLYGIYRHGPLRWMWLAIALSFAFYLPVAVGAQKHPKLGMLMLPKTCMYIWMLFMCAAL